jgi:ABC-type branched-subunit amino acid transport system ATPase component
MATGHPTHAPDHQLSMADKLLNHADGSPTTEAAVIILTTTARGGLLDAVDLAWEDHRMAAIDWPITRSHRGHLSGGERRLLELADSLATGHPVDLADTVTGLDPVNAQVVVDAIAHAAGVHHWGYER